MQKSQFKKLEKKNNFGTIDQSDASIQLHSQSKAGASFQWKNFLV